MATVPGSYTLPNIPSMVIPDQNAPSNQLPTVPQYAPKDNLGADLGNLVSTVNSYKQGVQDQKTKAFQAAYGQAYASGDRQALIKLAANNPEQIQAIQQGVGFLDANANKELGTASVQLRIAGQQGPQAVAAVAQNHASALAQVGLTPQAVTQAYQQDPNMLAHYADQIGMAALGPKDYFDQQDKLATQGIQMRGQDITSQGQQMTAQTAANGQAVEMRGQNITASNSAADRQIKMLELQQTQQQNAVKNASTQVEMQKNQAQLQATNQKIQTVQQQKQTALTNMAQASDLARSIAADPNLSNITGTVKGVTPTFRDSSQDLINKANQLQALLTGQNTKILSGSMSDKDLMFIKALSSGLNIGDNGIKGGYQQTQQKLLAIADKLDTNLRGQQIPGTVPQGGTQNMLQGTAPVTRGGTPVPTTTPAQQNTVSWSQLP